MPKGQTPKKRMARRKTKPLRKILAGLTPLVGGAMPKTAPKMMTDKFKNVLKNVKARRKAGATDSSSRLKLETAYDRARKRKSSGRINADDLKRAAKLSPAQRRKKLKGN